MMRNVGCSVVLALLLLGMSPPAAAQDGPRELGITINASVVDGETNQPVPGATVSMFVETPTHLVSDGGRALDGTIVFEARAGLVTLIGRSEGYAPALIEFQLNELSSKEHRISLLKPSSISGRVMKKDGSPARGARVQVDYPNKEFLANLVRGSAVAAEDGSFEISGLLPGDTHVYATFDGMYSDKKLEVLQAGGKLTDVTLTVKK